MLIAKIKKLFSALCITAALFLASCDTEPNAISDENVVRNIEVIESTNRIEIPAAGFSVVPPIGFTINLQDFYGVQMLAVDATVQTGPMIAIFGSEFGDEISADQMYDIMILGDDTLSDVVRLPYPNLEGDGFMAEFTTVKGEQKSKGQISLTLINNQGILVTAIAPEEEWETGFGWIVDSVQASIEIYPQAEG